jgi:DNA-binding MarR family transcriptional regulator
MDSAEITPRAQQLDEIAEALPQRASALSQIFLTQSTVCVSRTEVGVLRRLAEAPRRVSALAVDERVTQPAITLLVNRLAERGWVRRSADPLDRRAVLVSLTPAGEDALARLRAEYRALVHEEMAELGDDEVRTLADAVQILDGLIGRLSERAA